MKKDTKHKDLTEVLQDESSVADLINKMQQQLSIIEVKLDALINQSQKRPFEKSYSQRPFRRPDHSSRHGRGGQGDGPRERTFTQVICADCNKECEIPFKPRGDSPVYCRECFPRHKRNNQFNADRDRGPVKRSNQFNTDRDRGHQKRSNQFNTDQDREPQKRDFTRKRRPDKKQVEKGKKPIKKAVKKTTKKTLKKKSSKKKVTASARKKKRT